MADEPKPRGPGRPILGERVPLGLRVTRDTKERLDRAADASGRSQSQEAEFRLENTFNAENAVRDALDLAYGRRWAGILLALAHIGQRVGTRGVFFSQFIGEGAGVDAWLDDPWTYDQVVRAVLTVLEEFRPPGQFKSPPDAFNLPPTTLSRIGQDFARAFLNELEGPDDGSGDEGMQAIRGRLEQLFPKAASKAK